MTRTDIGEHVEEAVSCPVLARRVQHVVEDIEECVPGSRTKEMMYELVDIILQMGQRVRALEMRTVAGNIRDELERQSAHQPSRQIKYSQDFPLEDEHAHHR